jgi:hypothetical protein
MAEVDDWVPASNSNAAPSGSSSSSAGVDDWVPVSGSSNYNGATPGSAMDEHEQRVASFQDKAGEVVKNLPMSMSVLHSNIPIIGDIADKAAAYVTSYLPTGEDLYGTDQNERYKNILAFGDAVERARKSQQSNLASGIEKTGNIVGGLAMAPSLGVEAAAANVLPSALAKGAGLLGEGVAYGAAGAAAESPAEASWGDLAKNTATGAGMGAAVSGALGAALGTAGALGKAGKYVYNQIANPEEAAIAKFVSNANKNPTVTGIAPEDWAQTSRLATVEPVNLADIQGAKDFLGKAAAKVPDSPAIQTINDALANREADMSNRIGKHVDRLFGQPIDTYTLREQSKAAYQAASKPAYNLAYSQPQAQNMQNRDLLNILSNPHGLQAAKDAHDTLNSMSFATPPGGVPGTLGQSSVSPFPFVKDADTGLWYNNPNASPPNLQFWDEVKKQLNATYNRPSLTPGEKTGVGQMQTWLTGYLRNTVPEYGAALDTAKKYLTGVSAFEDGLGFMKIANSNTTTKPGLLSQTLSNFNKNYNAADKEQFSTAIGAYIKDNPLQAAKFFQNADNKTLNSIKQVIGGGDPIIANARYNSLVANMALQNLMNATTKITARGAAEHGLTAGELAAVTGGEHVLTHGVGSLFHPATILTMATGMLGKIGYNAVQKRQAEAILNLVARSQSDPTAGNKLTQILSKPAQQSFVNDLSKRIARYSSEQVGPISHENGGTVGFARGGKVQSGHQHLVDRLFRLGEQAKKTEKAHTEPLLNLPDETVAKALDVAQRAI